jgi:hypothetical protein
MEDPKAYHYNYQALDKFLSNDFDPKELGNQLDELMADLVHLAKHEDDFGTSLSDHHFTLRKLRDIFWWQLPKNYGHSNH